MIKANLDFFKKLDYVVSFAWTVLQHHRIGCIYLSSKCSNNHAKSWYYQRNKMR